MFEQLRLMVSQHGSQLFKEFFKIYSLTSKSTINDMLIDKGVINTFSQIVTFSRNSFRAILGLATAAAAGTGGFIVTAKRKLFKDFGIIEKGD